MTFYLSKLEKFRAPQGYKLGLSCPYLENLRATESAFGRLSIREKAESEDDPSILFSCRCPERPSVDIHTHGHAQNLGWNFGINVITGKDDDAKHLKGPANRFWQEFNKNSVKEALKDTEPVPRIKIPGAKLFLAM